MSFMMDEEASNIVNVKRRYSDPPDHAGWKRGILRHSLIGLLPSAYLSSIFRLVSNISKYSNDSCMIYYVMALYNGHGIGLVRIFYPCGYVERKWLSSATRSSIVSNVLARSNKCFVHLGACSENASYRAVCFYWL